MTAATELFDITDRVAIITGASSGLGARFARVLAGAGGRVVLAARRIERLEKLAAELGKESALAVQVDVTTPDEIDRLVERAVDHFGGLGLMGSGRIPQASYAASKGGVVNLTRELAAEWAPSGVRVNALAPGWFKSEMTASMWTESGNRFIERYVPARRPGQEHELDRALLFLASDASTYVMGQTIVVDGGFVTV